MERKYLILTFLILSFITVFVSSSYADSLSYYKFHSVQKEIILKALKEFKTKITDKEEQKQETYNAIRGSVDKARIEEEKLSTLKKNELLWPEEIAKFKKQIKEGTQLTERTLVIKYEKLPLDDIEKRLNKKRDVLGYLQKTLTSISTNISDERTMPEINQKQLAQNYDRLSEIHKQMSQLKEEADFTQQEQKNLALSAEILFIESQNDVLTEEIKNNSLHLEFLTFKKQLLLLESGNIEKEIQHIQKIVNEKRQEINKAIVEKTENTEKTHNHLLKTTLLQELHTENASLSQVLLEITKQINQLTNMSEIIHNQLKTVSVIRQDIDQQTSLVGTGVLLARTLRESLMHLPNIVVDRNLSERITDYRLQKFQYEQKRQHLNSPDEFINKIRGDTIPSDKEHAEARILLDNQIGLLDSLSSNTGKLLLTAITLQIDQQKLYVQSKALSESLRQRLFWIVSSPPVSFSWLINLPAKTWNELNAIPWKEGIVNAGIVIYDHWLILLIIILCCSYLYLKRHTFSKWQKSMVHRIGHINKDSLLLTPGALLLSLLFVMPIALVIIVVALLLFISDHGHLIILGHGLLWSTATWVICSFFSDLLKPDGIAHTHFHWSAQYCYNLRQQLNKLKHLLVLMTFLVNIVEKQPWELDQDILGMILLMLGTLMQVRLIYMLFKNFQYLLGSKIAHTLMFILLPGLSLVQTFLIAMGYYYTALILEHQILGTLILIGGFSLLQALAIRSINIGEHRLAYQRAVKKFTATDNKPFEEPALDLATVNQQSLRLLNAALIVGFAVLFYWVWKNFATVFSAVSSLTLWTYHTGDETSHIYLSNIFLVIIILATTQVLARNLPGLLEITLLSRLKIPQGNSYATTTLLSYSITSLGFILTLSCLGFSWEKLQWLVAAIGLGLSIGLKEVFANVLSGLIILFERPIRLGDTISVGDMIGEVSRIRVRATTIISWDHQEIIVPNAVLLNEKLVNWSLSNSVVRIILSFYIAHNSDMNLVEELLLQAAKAHVSVVDTPKSIATLAEYGDSALCYELRVFITHINQRLIVRNALNKQVNQLFEEHGIKVAPKKQLLAFVDS